MQNPRETRTNAADSAPGVDDGRVRPSGAAVDSKPGGRRIVWLIVAAALVVLLAIFIARPRNQETGAGQMVTPGGTSAEIESSTVPGTQNEAAAPVAPPAQPSEQPQPAQP